MARGPAQPAPSRRSGRTPPGRPAPRGCDGAAAGPGCRPTARGSEHRPEPGPPASSPPVPYALPERPDRALRLEPDARVDDGVREIDDQVDHHVDRGEDQDHSLDRREILVL